TVTKPWNTSLEDMLEAGVHFGHQARRWNPKMAPYILAERKGIHIIDSTQTARFLSEACDLLTGVASKGKQFLIVGTKHQAADATRAAAIRAQRHHANEKWFGGMLTNWPTAETRPQRSEDSEGGATTGFQKYRGGEGAASGRQLVQPRKYPGGTRYMKGLPDVATIPDQRKEYTATRERQILGIPTTCSADTDCDPDLAGIPTPGNDDSRASIQWILNELTLAIREGRNNNKSPV
uniref:Small ribosomal subunit protein uS2c n=1 Tax=Megaloselaginella exaltata TaxID=3140882 RepID=A0A7U3UJB7_9TRAC|nr:ribosomal protein S2 [Selaginella exaltata]